MNLPRVLRVATVLLAVSSVAALVPVSRRAPKIEGEGRLDPSGPMIVTRDDQPTTITGPRTLLAGDTVQILDGTAKVGLPGGDLLELRSHTIISFDRGPALRSGSVLVITAAGSPRAVKAAGSQVDAVGTTRIDAALALRVAAYGGAAVVRSGGRTLEVPALREASVPVLGVLRGPLPLAIDPQDPWDKRLLGDAATRKVDLDALADGFTGQVSAANATSAAYYRGLFTGLVGQAAFQQAAVNGLGRAAVDTTSPAGTERFRAGDVLVGAAVALQGRRGSFADRLSQATSFRAEGAPWTLVALDQQVPSIDALVRMVDSAVNVAPLELAAPSSPPTAGPVAVPAGTPVPVTPPPPTTVAPGLRPAPTTTTTRPTRTTPTTLPQAQQPPPAPGTVVVPLAPLLGAVVDPVTKLLSDILARR